MSSGPSTASAEARVASEAGTGSQTVVTKEETDGASASAPPTLRLKLKKPDEKDQKKVKWTSETVDNEHLGKDL